MSCACQFSSFRAVLKLSFARQLLDLWLEVVKEEREVGKNDRHPKIILRAL